MAGGRLQLFATFMRDGLDLFLPFSLEKTPSRSIPPPLPYILKNNHNQEACLPLVEGRANVPKIL
jgi:hypothetical protein